MSKRITTETEIKDMEIAQKALRDAGMTFKADGSYIHITSGALANATINLTTGLVEGDSDFKHTKSSLGILRQHYAEAKLVHELAKQGGYVESRNVNKEGEIELIYQIG